MEPEPQAGNRLVWVAIAALGVGVLIALAIILDLGPFADEPLSEAEFLARADRICADAHSDYERLQDSPPSTAAEATELTQELVDISHEELDQISDLDAPAAVETPLERYLHAREDGINKLREGADAAEKGDAFAYSAAQAKVASGQLDRQKLAKAVGLEECSKVLFGRDALAEASNPPVELDPGAPPTVNNPPTGTP
jgi:hypothetical protein